MKTTNNPNGDAAFREAAIALRCPDGFHVLVEAFDRSEGDTHQRMDAALCAVADKFRTP